MDTQIGWEKVVVETFRRTWKKLELMVCRTLQLSRIKLSAFFTILVFPSLVQLFTIHILHSYELYDR